MFMERALELAELGAGWVNPNPLVGAVLVKEGRIIGEGWHKAHGQAHAEANAFQNAAEDVRGADLYVTLEPCSHFGKNPPCAKAVVEKGIRRVFVGITDPNPLVSGRGVELLREAGVQVTTGVLEEQCREQNRVFLKYITTGLPYCVLKSAMTLDGKIATHTGDSRWVTGPVARQEVHRLRHRLSAIMVGIGTVLADNPALTTRLEGTEPSHPVRIVVDTRARTPLDAKILDPHSPAGAIIAVGEQAPMQRLRALEEKGAQILVLPQGVGGLDLGRLMEELGKQKLDSVLLEGGGTLNASALAQGVVDEVHLFLAPKLIGGAQAPTPVEGAGITKMADAISLTDTGIRQLGNDWMITGKIKGRGDA